MFKTSDVIGVHQINSVDFVKSAFEVYNSGNVLVILKQSGSGLRLKEERIPKPGGGWLEVRQQVILEDRPAQIVFTSGTEGAPKAILLSHRALADVVVRLNKTMNVDSTIREYVGIPVTYSFGFGRCRAVAAAGGSCYIPEKGFNPTEIARLLAADEINAISAVPTLWRTLLVQPELIGALGKKVKWIEIGSQYMSRAEKEKMKALFPHANIVQHYGLTEASRTTFLNVTETEGDLLESVGKPEGEVEVKISRDGRIMIRGPHVAMGQIVGEQLRPLVDSDGWYTTGDFGRVERGHHYYEGRADDLINCGGVKVNPELLQERINRRLNVENRIAVARIDDKLRGDGIFVGVEKGPAVNLNLQEVQEVAVDELMALGVNAKSSVRVQQVEDIPRTDTGKVRRKELSKMYAAPVAQEMAPGKSLDRSTVQELFASMFPGTNVGTTDTFRSLGGDSLNYVQMLMSLERRLGVVPADWDRMTVGDLERIEPRRKSPLFAWLDTSIFLRVIAIIGVVATHSGGTILAGGTWLLFILIGYNMARFKSADLAGGRVWQWLKTYLVAILIPYYIVTAVYLRWNHSFEVDELLLFANLVDAKITIVFPFWFVQVLLQCLVLFGILFSIPWFRRYSSRSAATFSLAVLACLIAIRFVYPVFWDTRHLNNLVPLRFMPILWLGWCFYFVTELRQKILLCVIGIVLAVLDAKFKPESMWMIAGSLFLAFVPHVPVPTVTKRILNDVGAATFYIFIFNGIVISMLAHIIDIESRFLVFCISMLVSMGVWWMMERMKLIARIQNLLNMKSKTADVV